ncbi:MAG TPA: site-specific integrase [Ferruginibacter sp.]|jgi:site-specific recombinase XerD|nr:site-specific integrase [Ferruginibacter sp.]
MNKTFTLLFYAKKSKMLLNGMAPIYLRITIDSMRTEFTVKRNVDPEKWDGRTQKAIGNTEDIRSLNAYLKTVEQQVYDAHHLMMKDREEITAASLRARMIGKEEKVRMLVPIIQDHNKKVKQLVGNEFSPNTLKRYETSLRHTIEFLKWKFNTSDIDIRKVDHAFITEYEFFLRSVRKCNNNSAVKYIRNFGKVIRICVANGWLNKNPFANYKSHVREVERVFLNEEELQAMSEKEFSIERISQVRDIFLFCCYTGLAYIDVKQLTPNHINFGIDGEKWIFINRQKTDTRSNIPLLPMAESLINKYKNHPQCVNEGRVFPVLSNQKMNSYLKEIADACGIKKELTFHIARHTFATTVTLTNGVSIESVSKMLGHKNIRTTQHYAKILDKKVSEDMKLLREKFKLKNLDEEIRLTKTF